MYAVKCIQSKIHLLYKKPHRTKLATFFTVLKSLDAGQKLYTKQAGVANL